MPLGTVVIPLKNVGVWVAEAIASVDSPHALDLEILCVDDGSTDNTLEVVHSLQDPRVRVVPNAGVGVADGRNTGVHEARGEEIFYLDGDDRFVPGSIAALHEGLMSHPEVAAVVGYSSFIDETGHEIANSRPALPEGLVNETLLDGYFIHMSAFAFRRKDLLEVGWARNFFKLAQDRDFLFRLAEQRQVWYFPVRVTELRIRKSSVSRTTNGHVKEWYTDRAQEFREQRKATGSDDLMRDAAPELPDDLPVFGQESENAFANRLIIAAAWSEARRGDFACARKHLARSLLDRKYFAYSLLEKLKLAAYIVLRELT